MGRTGDGPGGRGSLIGHIRCIHAPDRFGIPDYAFFQFGLLQHNHGGFSIPLKVYVGQNPYRGATPAECNHPQCAMAGQSCSGCQVTSRPPRPTRGLLMQGQPIFCSNSWGECNWDGNAKRGTDTPFADRAQAVRYLSLAILTASADETRTGNSACQLQPAANTGNSSLTVGMIRSTCVLAAIAWIADKKSGSLAGGTG